MGNYIQKNYVEGKVVIITGASSGFGKLVAEKVAEMGGIPVIGARREAALKAVADGITAKGGKVFWRVTDVTKAEDLEALAKLAIDNCGKIDVMVNNAGTMPLAYYADHAVALKAWEACIDTNLKGTLYGICAVYDQMVAQGEGQVINVSSIYANHPVAGSAVYQATKVGVEYLAESLRQETQGKIKVSCIKPTGVPATELFGGIINMSAPAEMLGMKVMDYLGMSQEKPGRPDLQDIEDIHYLDCDPNTLADNIIYLINQPMGVSISDITVRSSNERYML